MHSHKCLTCGRIWNHSDSCVNDKEAHECCGRPWWVQWKEGDDMDLYREGSEKFQSIQGLEDLMIDIMIIALARKMFNRRR